MNHQEYRPLSTLGSIMPMAPTYKDVLHLEYPIVCNNFVLQVRFELTIV